VALFAQAGDRYRTGCGRFEQKDRRFPPWRNCRRNRGRINALGQQTVGVLVRELAGMARGARWKRSAGGLLDGRARLL
jgi:hypothetical protein